jgi:hypothetical protein
MSAERGPAYALGEEAFASTVAPRGLRRKLPLGEAFNERKSPFAERNLALGGGLESGSVGWVSTRPGSIHIPGPAPTQPNIHPLIR